MQRNAYHLVSIEVDVPKEIRVADTIRLKHSSSVLKSIGEWIMTKETKVCRKCGQERPIEKFSVGKTMARGNVCTICQYEREKERTSKNKTWWFDMDWIYGRV